MNEFTNNLKNKMNYKSFKTTRENSNQKQLTKNQSQVNETSTVAGRVATMSTPSTDSQAKDQFTGYSVESFRKQDSRLPYYRHLWTMLSQLLSWDNIKT